MKLKLILTFCLFDQRCQPRHSRYGESGKVEKAFVNFLGSVVVVAVVGSGGCSWIPCWLPQSRNSTVFRYNHYNTAVAFGAALIR